MTKLLYILLIFPLMLLSQSISDDSLLKRAHAVMYDSPEETIKITKGLTKKTKSSEKTAHYYMLLSNAYIAKRDIDSSLYYINQTSNLINNSDIKIATKVRILNHIAVQYQQMELYDKALETLDRSQELCNQIPAGRYHRNYYSEFINIVRGMVYRAQSNPEMALEKFKSALKYYKTIPADKSLLANMSVIAYNIGNCYLDLKQFGPAEIYFNESTDYAKKAQSKSLESFAYKGMAEKFYLIHQYDKSLELLKKAEDLAIPVGDLTLKEGIYKLMSDNYLVLNDWQDYQTYNQKYQEVRQTKEASELKSLNRYINLHSDEISKKKEETSKRFGIYQIILVATSLILLLFLINLIKKTRQINKYQQEKISEFLNTDRETKI